MRLAWTDLRIFLHVCEAGSMSAAAARCHLTLAAVSARVRKLEADNGLVLLRRGPRGVAPTAAGTVLAAHARVVFEQVQRLERELLHAGTEAASQRLVLLANSSALARPLSDALATSAAADTRILVRESASEATVQALRSGAADVGIVSDAVETRGLMTVELGPDPLVVVVARAHPLAGASTLRFAQALAQPWIAWGEQSALSTHLQLQALAQGTRVEAAWTYPTLDGVLRLVARGLGVTVLPRVVLAGHPAAAALACVALEEAWANRRLRVCHAVGGRAERARLVEGIVGVWRDPPVARKDGQGDPSSVGWG